MKSILWLFLAGVFLIIGCTPAYNPLTEYPAFKKQSKNFEQAILAVDAIVVENSRRRSTLDYDRQITVLKSFQKEFSELLLDKEIQLDTTFYGSSGLFLEEGASVDVSDLIIDSTVVDSGRIIEAPFYRSVALKKNRLFEERILISIQDTAAWEIEINTEDYSPKELLFVCIIEGVNTPLGKQLGQAFLTALATLGNAYSYQQSYLYGRLYVFDLENNKLLWYDERGVTGDLANHRTARSLASLFSKKIPPQYRRSYK